MQLQIFEGHTAKSLANETGLSLTAIRRAISKRGWARNGVTTYLTDEQAVQIKKDLLVNATHKTDSYKQNDLTTIVIRSEDAQLIVLSETIKNAYEKILTIKEERISRLQKQNDTLQIKLDQHNDWISVRRYNIEFNGNEWDLSKCQKVGRDLSHYCRENNIEVRKSLDPLFGEVNAYPLSVFDKSFGGVI